MQDWVKIVSSTVIGVFAGLAAEPIKTTVQNWFMARHIRFVLHREVVRLEKRFTLGSGLTEPNHLERASYDLAQFNTDAFDYYFETQRGLFYSDEKLAKMRSVFEGLKEFLVQPLEGVRSFHDAREWGLGLIKDAITLKIFDEALVNKYRRDEKNFDTMMFWAGGGDLTEEDIIPKPRAGIRKSLKKKI